MPASHFFRRLSTWLLAAAMLVTAVPATAGEPVVPDRADSAVMVKTAQGPEIFHLLQGGQTLTFSFEEGGRAYIVARRRLPAASVTPPPVPLEVGGDGQRFLVVRVGQGHDDRAVIHDGGGGAPSGADVAEVDVPAGGRALTVRSQPGAPDVFVRVQKGGPAPR